MSMKDRPSQWRMQCKVLHCKPKHHDCFAADYSKMWGLTVNYCKVSKNFLIMITELRMLHCATTICFKFTICHANFRPHPLFCVFSLKSISRYHEQPRTSLCTHEKRLALLCLHHWSQKPHGKRTPMCFCFVPPCAWPAMYKVMRAEKKEFES